MITLFFVILKECFFKCFKVIKSVLSYKASSKFLFNFSACTVLRKQSNAHNSLLSVPTDSQDPPKPYILRLSEWWKCSLMVDLLYVVEQKAWRRGQNEGVVPHTVVVFSPSEQLPYIPGSMREAKLSLKWLLHTCGERTPFNHRHQGDAPAFVTVLNGILNAMPFSQLIIEALLV